MSFAVASSQWRIYPSRSFPLFLLSPPSYVTIMTTVSPFAFRLPFKRMLFFFIFLSLSDRIKSTQGVFESREIFFENLNPDETALQIGRYATRNVSLRLLKYDSSGTSGKRALSTHKDATARNLGFSDGRLSSAASSPLLFSSQQSSLTAIRFIVSWFVIIIIIVAIGCRNALSRLEARAT